MNSNETMGRVKTVPVFGCDSDAQGMLSSVIARRSESKNRQRLRFTGNVHFSNPVKRHIRGTLVPIVDRILLGLQLPARSFEVSALNLGAASALDVGVSISGFSADVSVLVALLSAALQIPVADDFVVTGHIASSDGDIRMVKSLAAKVQAVEAEGAIHRFLYPDLEQDQSLKSLSPAERQRGIAAVMGVRDSLQTQAVRGIDEVVQAVFTEENIVLASLREGFFAVAAPRESDSPVAKTLSWLTQDNSPRFWRLLQQCLFAGDSQRGRRLLEALVDFRIARESYESGLGAKLLDLLRSVPPAVRRLQIEFPLVDTARCLKLGEFAARADHQDLLKLLDAVHCKGMAAAAPEGPAAQPTTAAASEADYATFDAVVAQINEQALSRKFGIPIDSARGSYILSSSTVQSQEEFHEILEAFYVHVHRWLSGGAGESPNADAVRSEAMELLQNAFRDRGGEPAAYAMARDGSRGGLRCVLDAVAEQCKRQRCAAHVRAVFSEAVSDMEWDERVRFTRAVMKRLEPFLPEIRLEPPERFAREPEVIVQSYVEFLDGFSRLLRTF